MKILLVNDDGIESPSIRILAKALSKVHDVTVVAPEIQRSAFSHAITMLEVITAKRCDFDGVKAYAISGTPGDCTKLGLRNLCKETDVVISGINLGWNVGTDIPYSGTIAAATEGVLLGIPAIALSREYSPGYDYEYECNFTLAFLKQLDFSVFDSKIMLNINFPEEAPKGIRITTPARLDYGEYYDEISNDGQIIEYKLHGVLKDCGVRGTDAHSVRRGYISITPLGVDRTSRHLFDTLSKITL